MTFEDASVNDANEDDIGDVKRLGDDGMLNLVAFRVRTNTCPDSVHTMMDPSTPNATSLTALDFLRSAQTRWHLNGPPVRDDVAVSPSGVCMLTLLSDVAQGVLVLAAVKAEEEEELTTGAKIYTSPWYEREASRSPQLVILAIRESFTACGGRYGEIGEGKAWTGKLNHGEMVSNE